MNRLNQFFTGLIALAIALAAAFYGRSQYLKEVSTCQIPVPIAAIPPYTLLRPDLFQMREMPRAMQSLAYYQSLQNLDGLITTAPLSAGLPVPLEGAVPAERFRLADAAYEVVSIPVEPVSAVGGQVRIGQRVNLYTLVPEAGKLESQVTRIAANIQVVDVRNAMGAAAEAQSSPEESDSFNSTRNEQVQILTLAVDPARVQEILEAVATAEKQGGLLWTTLALP